MQTLYLNAAVTRLWHWTQYWTHLPLAISAKSKYWQCIHFSTSLFRYWHLALIACFQSSVFRQGAHDIRVRMKCKNIKMWLVIGGLVSAVLTVAVLLACGVMHLWGLMFPVHALMFGVSFVILTELIVICVELWIVMQMEENDIDMVMTVITYHPSMFRLCDQMPYTGGWSVLNYTQTAKKFLKLERIKEHGGYKMEISSS